MGWDGRNGFFSVMLVDSLSTQRVIPELLASTVFVLPVKLS